jgi:hypothetical protein
MAGPNRPAILIAGAAGLCLSVATGVGLGHYTATGMNPLYSEDHYAAAYGDESHALDGTVGDSAAVDHFSEAAARSLTSPDFSDGSNDES